MSARFRKAGLPYLLLLPGLGWLAVFFLIPLGYMAFESLKEGTLDTGFIFSWQFSNYTDAISDYNEQFLRSFEYAALATIAALLIGYPLAYFIAFRGGKWRNAMLLAVIAPFFVTYLIRTLSWETILSDSGFVVDTLKTVGILGEDGRLLDTTFSVVAGITYNFLPFMILPLYASLERIDHRLLEAGYDLGQLSRLGEGLAGVLDELRELSRGIHPAILSEGGLDPALRALERRSPVPLELDLELDGRLEEPTEVAAYYVVSEALTNTAKHAQASRAQVRVEARDDTLEVTIRDDGVGGADPAGGSGLIGLADRVEALGGTLDISSPRGEGTSLHVSLPLGTPAG